MDNKDYTKMYLVPPEVLRKLQQEESLNNELDQSMYKIAKMSKMDVMQKWLLYRQQLSKYMNKKRNYSAAVVANNGEKQNGLMFDRGVQTTKRIKKSDKNPSTTTTMSVQTGDTDNRANDGIPAVDEDEIISQLAPPVITATRSNDEEALNDELLREQEALEDENFVIKRKKTVRKAKVSESHDDDNDDSDVQIVEEQAPKRSRTKQPTVRKPTTRKASKSRSRSSTTKVQTGSGDREHKRKTTIKWICMP